MPDITLGIIGSGQLGSMLCQAAKKLNVKTVVISDDAQGPAQNFSDRFIFAKYDDQKKIKEFIDQVDVVTFEFENIPVDILKKIHKEKKVFPKPSINKIIQNRKLEKVKYKICDISNFLFCDGFFVDRLVTDQFSDRHFLAK